jgi:hypothetical protein
VGLQKELDSASLAHKATREELKELVGGGMPGKKGLGREGRRAQSCKGGVEGAGGRGGAGGRDSGGLGRVPMREGGGGGGEGCCLGAAEAAGSFLYASATG